MNFFLDDGVAAGSAEAVDHWLGEVEKELADMGLELCRNKCLAVPAKEEGAVREEGKFVGMEWHPQQEFKLLGAWFGGKDGA